MWSSRAKVKIAVLGRPGGVSHVKVEGEGNLRESYSMVTLSLVSGGFELMMGVE